MFDCWNTWDWLVVSNRKATLVAPTAITLLLRARVMWYFSYSMMRSWADWQWGLQGSVKEGAQDVSWERNVFEALAGPSLENSPAKHTEFGLYSIKHAWSAWNMVQSSVNYFSKLACNRYMALVYFPGLGWGSLGIKVIHFPLIEQMGFGSYSLCYSEVSSEAETLYSGEWRVHAEDSLRAALGLFIIW